MRRAASVLIALVPLVAAGGARQQPLQQPSRDGVATSIAGTATISGVVVDDEEPAKPVRRAILTLTGAELKPNRGAITDDEGRFTIAHLPAGRFTLTVTRAGFITSVFGAKRPGRPGTALTVADGSMTANLVVRLWRGAAVAGVIRDEAGAPVQGIPVTAVPARAANGRTILTLSNSGATTNDLGEFRIFGLEPGSYVISARPPAGVGGPMTGLSEAQVDAALDALGRRGPPSSPAAPVARGPSMTAPTFDYAPVFYPGTAVVEQATPIALTAGQERTDLNFSLQRVPTTTVGGTVTLPDGTAAVGANVQLAEASQPGSFSSGEPRFLNATAGPDGMFKIVQVPPGEYRLVVRGREAARPAGSPATGGAARPPAGSPWLWATTAVSVSGSSVDGLSLKLEPGVTISGRIVFDTKTSSAQPPPKPDLSRLRVDLALPMDLKPGTPIYSISFFVAAAVQADGTFRLSGVLPDTYGFHIYGLDAASGWSARSAPLGDRDLLDGPVEVTRDASVVVTLSDRHAELSGTLQTPAGAPVSDVFVILFAENRDVWGAGSRRVQAVRPGVDGRFLFNDVPPGAYLLGAVTDVDQDEWQDPAFLERLAASSVKVQVAEGEKRVQDLRLGGGTVGISSRRSAHR